MPHSAKDIKKLKQYRKNSLGKRIGKITRWTNFFSSLIFAMFMLVVISVIIGFIGDKSTMAVASILSDKVSQIYLERPDDQSFNDALKNANLEEQLNVMFIDADTLLQVDDTLTEEDFNFNVFEFRIEHKEGVYDSNQEAMNASMLQKNMEQNVLRHQFFRANGVEFYDEDGRALGKILVRISPDMIALILIMVIFIGLSLLMVNALINKMITLVMARIVARPLEMLAVQMKDLAEEELEDAFDRKLMIKRPVSEVSSLMNSTDKIMNKMSEYYQTMLAQNQELEAQRDELESQNQQLGETSQNLLSMNKAYLDRTIKLQNLLDNVGQGFITFGKDLLINPEYSTMCTNLFCLVDGDIDLAGHKISGLMCDEDEDTTFVDDLLVKVLNGSDRERHLLLPLLPEEIELHGRHVHLDYKLVKDESNQDLMMVIMTDITENRNLEQQMNIERERLQMMVKVLINREDTLNLIHSFKSFLRTEEAELTAADMTMLTRQIHTFKGNFSQFYMKHTSSELELVENELSEGERFTNQMCDALSLALDQDLTIIQSYTGSDFETETDIYTIKEEKILQIENQIKNLLPADEFRKILPIIKSIRYRSVKDGLRMYPDYVDKLAERLGKNVLPFEVTGDDIFVDFDIYQDVFKNMVHLFRNAVDHGVEVPDDRILMNKSEEATITCHVSRLKDEMQIMVSDDGRGIDVESLHMKAQKMNLDLKDSQDPIMLIFEQGLSTKDNPNAVSGRGVGLNALQHEVKRLGGQIKVSSSHTRGTTFTVVLPILQSSDVDLLEPERFINHLEVVSQHYLEGLEITFKDIQGVKEDVMTLHRVNALIAVRGSVDGIIIISVNEKMAKVLARKFIFEPLNDLEIIEYTEDVLGEVANTILGNVLGRLEEDGFYLGMGVPFVISNERAYVKYTNHEIHGRIFEEKGSIFGISLLLTHHQELFEDLMDEVEYESFKNQIEGGL